MNNIYQLVYYEGKEKYSSWSKNKNELKKMIKDWEKQGFGISDDIIKHIRYTNIDELIDQLNELGV
tara:strand:+ start:449 stop:646 length:198 start_codon:yes stop_codon:yes gene_type:complete